MNPLFPPRLKERITILCSVCGRSLEVIYNTPDSSSRKELFYVEPCSCREEYYKEMKKENAEMKKLIEVLEEKIEGLFANR